MHEEEITGYWKVRIFKKEDWYIAKIWANDGKSHWFTQGRTKEEILEMIADCIMCGCSIKISWWNKILSRLMWFR